MADNKYVCFYICTGLRETPSPTKLFKVSCKKLSSNFKLKRTRKVTTKIIQKIISFYNEIFRKLTFNYYILNTTFETTFKTCHSLQNLSLFAQYLKKELKI